MSQQNVLRQERCAGERLRSAAAFVLRIWFALGVAGCATSAKLQVGVTNHLAACQAIEKVLSRADYTIEDRKIKSLPWLQADYTALKSTGASQAAVEIPSPTESEYRCRFHVRSSGEGIYKADVRVDERENGGLWAREKKEEIALLQGYAKELEKLKQTK